MLSTSALRRTILTSARSTHKPIVPPSLNRYNSLLTPRFFQTTATTMGVHNLASKAAFDEAVGKKDSLMVLDCFATWCGPCKVISPQVVKFSDQYTDANFYKLDVDEVPDVASELGIRAMPTFLLFKNGDKVGEVVGANPTALEAAIKQNL